ncbi:gag/pol protein [Cucumis melo var. makuwa]|uniref:Gag/pol protein n=1 Tax=Cucumis melo var. makuwa TaxID=1194695 RepID=A0A5D3BHV0_CUCMM|nr:gag/pol protein [Cucumis melo var. makuwa]
MLQLKKGKSTFSFSVPKSSHREIHAGLCTMCKSGLPSESVCMGQDQDECPQTLASNANRTSRKAYDRWVKANEKIRVYILACMTDVLVKKHESLATTKEIMDALKAMFGQLEWSLRHEAIKYIYTKPMKEGTSVREHVMHMMMHFNIGEVNDGAIDEANQVSFILESLPKSFIPFQTNASLNKIEFNLTTLLNELQRFQTITIVIGKGFQKARSLSRLEHERWFQLKQ